MPLGSAHHHRIAVIKVAIASRLSIISITISYGVGFLFGSFPIAFSSFLVYIIPYLLQYVNSFLKINKKILIFLEKYMCNKEQPIGYIDGKPVYSFASAVKESAEKLCEYIDEIVEEKNRMEKSLKDFLNN